MGFIEKWGHYGFFAAHILRLFNALLNKKLLKGYIFCILVLGKGSFKK
jgi:hypothetical protein